MIKKTIVFILLFLFFLDVKTQITQLENSNNTTLIGKIKLGNADATYYFLPKEPIRDGFNKITNNDEARKYSKQRNNANNSYSDLISYSSSFGDLSSSLVYFKDSNLFLLTFLNRVYDYKNESFWLNEKSKNDLYLIIKKVISEKKKFNNLELEIEGKMILLLGSHKKKVSLNLWDGYKWYRSSWYKNNKLMKLFGENN